MSFYNLSYFLFLGTILLVARRLRGPSSRAAALLAASYLFYALLTPVFLPLLAGVSLFSHYWAKLLRQRRRSTVLWIGIVLNAAILVSSRYSVALLAFFGLQIPDPGMLLPIGVSFYTFQAIGYLMDVYRGYDEEPGTLEFLLFMSFWPVVLSGPICRLPEMLPQFRKTECANSAALGEGLRRIVFGLFMKVVLADTLAHGLSPDGGVEAGFDGIASGWSSLDVWFLCLGYGFQIYFDFAGYSHIAIGSARLFAIELRENFDNPYRSRNLSDFWNRWHMSLSSWIRDYLFFPLAAAFRGLRWRSLALVVSMTAFGLWHGLAWTFTLWGIYHGLLLAFHHTLKEFRRSRRSARRLPAAFEATLSWALTFSLVTVGWIFFRSGSLSQALRMMDSLLHPGRPNLLSLEYYGLVSVIGVTYFAWLGLGKIQAANRLLFFPGWLHRLALNTILLAAILMVIIWSDQASPFVYVRF